MAQLFVEIIDANGAHQKMDAWQLPSAQLAEGIVIRSPSVDANKLELYTANPSLTDLGLPVRPIRDAVSTSHAIAAASDNATVVKSSAAILKAVRVINMLDTWLFLKTYNKATTPTNADTVISCYGVQGGRREDIVLADPGRSYSVGLAYRVVLGVADNDNTAISVNGGTVDLEYL